jgi:dienelactone hydrolase
VPIGGVDNGGTGSTCVPRDSGAAPALEPGVSTSGLPGTAPAYYEFGTPAGAYLGQSPKGVMILIHGGGWYSVGAGDVGVMRVDADRWRARGWQTLSITYRGCSQSVPDVLTFHDLARQWAGAKLPICAEGGSAGAHLAVLMAALRPDVACAIGEGTPADFATLAAESAFQPDLGGALMVANMEIAAFGVAGTAYDPALHPDVHGRLLLATAVQDWYIPQAQATDLAAAIRVADPAHYVDVYTAAAGSGAQFVHGTTTALSLQDFYAHEQRLVAPVLGGPATVITDVRIPTMGNAIAGTLTLHVAGGVATATGRVGLAPGHVYDIRVYMGDLALSGNTAAHGDTMVDTRGRITNVGVDINATTVVVPAGSYAAAAMTVTVTDYTPPWVGASSVPPMGLDEEGVIVP